MTYYSMKDLVTEICKEKVYTKGADSENLDFHAGNRVKYIRNKLLPNLGLTDFIKAYENSKRKPYSHGWYDFFSFLIDKYELDGTTTKNHARTSLKQSITINNVFTIMNGKIFTKLIEAIKSGDNAEFYLQELKKTKFYIMAQIFNYKVAISYNFEALFKDLENSMETISEEKALEILRNLLSKIPALFEELNLPFPYLYTDIQEKF